MKAYTKPAKRLFALLAFVALAANITSCEPKDENNELDICKQVTPAHYADKLHFRVLNKVTGTDLMANGTPNRFTFENLTSWQYCNESHPLEEAIDYYKDAAGQNCVVFWFANLNAPDAYSPQECRRILMRWSQTDVDTLEWTTFIQPSGIPSCDSFEVLHKVFFNSEVIHPLTQDGQAFYPLYKTN
ncbi:MAG: hypothetical protein JNL72_14515 [Flavipsychrobacter sp.]|nr:hypothetical protein [Flavipsychrobacter sp.]